MLDTQPPLCFDNPANEGAPTYRSQKSRTLSVVKTLKDRNEDFEWYPTTDEQINLIADDLKRISEGYELVSRNEEEAILDIGAGDGRVVEKLVSSLNEAKDWSSGLFKAHTIEKATTHINSYRHKNIALIGTEFNEVNLVSKWAEIAFVNAPYSEYESWVGRIIKQLGFSVLYAIMPRRWRESEAIKEALAYRGIEYNDVIEESDFHDAGRNARAVVDIVRFSFLELSEEALTACQEKREERCNQSRYYYKPHISRDSTSAFQLFLDTELGLRQTHSSTTEKFSEHCERERIKREMEDPESSCYGLVKSQGILAVLLVNYERDLEKVLNQYKLIGQLDGTLLAELGVEHKNILEGVRASF